MVTLPLFAHGITISGLGASRAAVTSANLRCFDFRPAVQQASFRTALFCGPYEFILSEQGRCPKFVVQNAHFLSPA